MLALYGLIFTEFDYGFIWFNFYLDFVAQNTIKNTLFFNSKHHRTMVFITGLTAMQAA